MKKQKMKLALAMVLILTVETLKLFCGTAYAAADVALGKTAAASSALDGYPASNANSGDESKIWCASDGTYPQWWKIDLGQNYDVTNLTFKLAPSSASFKYKIEVSTDNSSFITKVNKTSNYCSGNQNISFTAAARYVRITFTGSGTGDWASLSDVMVYANETNETSNLTGRVVYHSYHSYGDGTSQIFVLNLGTKELRCLSSEWTNVTDPMNAVWSPDGSRIIFMGINSNNSWDLYSYTIGAEGNPVNLTNSSDSREEDPKFFPGSNNNIVYKCTSGGTYSLKSMNIETNTVSTIYSSTSIECSMPYCSSDGSTIYFSGLSNGETDIYRVPSSGGSAAKVTGCSVSGAFEYYPIIKDNTGFYFTKHTNSAPEDQIYFKNLSSGTISSMLFNVSGYDNSDACVVDSAHTIISSTRSGGNGAYDLYICDNNTGNAWSLKNYNISVNTVKNELGACYTSTTD